jgi:flagellar hook protein FlgE
MGATMTSSNISRSGLNANSVRQTVSAHNVANTNTDTFAKQNTSQQALASGGTSTRVDTVTLSTEAKAIAREINGAQNNVDVAEETVSQIQSRENFKQNAAVVRTQDEMQKTLLDTTA